ncbi:hypothetical protein HDU97_002318 [Phlyctochytrium planicorne]|nr:hypothetical protein HDU97_002318 [Phlyctochytrium planicorne]
MTAMRKVDDFPLTKLRRLQNLVFMGQGEPLMNFKNVSEAVKFMTTHLGFTPWRITISTSGIAPLIPRISEELSASLAISLHAVSDDVRNVLVPINKQYPIRELMNAIQEYLKSSKHKRVTYVMLDHINDSQAMARELARLVRRFPAHINLIPFNPWPGSNYASSSNERIMRFKTILDENSIPCTIRNTKGDDILAACGQLRSSEERKAIFMKQARSFEK